MDQMNYTTRQLFVSQCHQFAADVLLGFDYDKQLLITLAELPKYKDTDGTMLMLYPENQKLVVLRHFVANKGNTAFRADQDEFGQRCKDLHGIIDAMFWYATKNQNEQLQERRKDPAITGLQLVTVDQEIGLIFLHELPPEVSSDMKEILRQLLS